MGASPSLTILEQCAAFANLFLQGEPDRSDKIPMAVLCGILMLAEQRLAKAPNTMASASCEVVRRLVQEGECGAIRRTVPAPTRQRAGSEPNVQ